MGSSYFSGGGICGFGPIPASSGNRAVPPQPASPSKLVANPSTLIDHTDRPKDPADRNAIDMEPGTAIKMPACRERCRVPHNTLLLSSTSGPAWQHFFAVSGG